MGDEQGKQENHAEQNKSLKEPVILLDSFANAVGGNDGRVN